VTVTSRDRDRDMIVGWIQTSSWGFYPPNNHVRWHLNCNLALMMSRSKFSKL
jgi:hypothetical protein